RLWLPDQRRLHRPGHIPGVLRRPRQRCGLPRARAEQRHAQRERHRSPIRFDRQQDVRPRESDPRRGRTRVPLLGTGRRHCPDGSRTVDLEHRRQRRDGRQSGLRSGASPRAEWRLRRPLRSSDALTGASFMPTPSRLLALALVAFVIVVATAAAATTRQPFKVTSTLDGKSVLPLRMHWLAYPKLRPSKVASVDFLIDGKVRWVEHHAPYNYASDDHGRNLGFLITTWLTAGPHRFTVRATDTIARKSTDSVVARVLPAANPP